MKKTLKLSYLNNSTWLDITREERLYCAHLYWMLQEKEKRTNFIQLINKVSTKQSKSDTKKKLLKLDSRKHWEIGYEVCFYRDYYHRFKESIKGTAVREMLQNKKLIKRTFDLCLFSEKDVVIIEAKVQQPFKRRQVDEIKPDKERVGQVLKDVNVHTLALASSCYIERHNAKYDGKDNFFNCFDAYISWLDLHNVFNGNKIFKRADNIYANEH